ncbi:MAG TPA: hypothetical protein VGE07_08460, partial [Herpetosiphonaceae bacterium]
RYIASIGRDTGLHPDFGAGLYDGGPIGIPFVVVPQNQAMVPINWTAYGDESDPGPYPIPPNAPIEGGNRPREENDGDRHVLVVRQGECKLYELYRSFPTSQGWDADSGAVYDLRSNALRTDGWTSADAAGLPILPGLVRYDEVSSGEIRHAIRFTVDRTRESYVWPARHQAGESGSLDLPPMGQRFRLKADFDISGFSPHVQVILRAMQRYGMILADNGSDWYVSGAPDDRWDNDVLHELDDVTGADFEAVDVSGWQAEPDSGRVIDAIAPDDGMTVTPGGAVQGQQVSFAIQIIGTNQPVGLQNVIPSGLAYVAGSLTTTPASPAATYSGGAVSWSGGLPDTQVVTIRYRATVDTAERRRIVSDARLDHGSQPRFRSVALIANPLQLALPQVRFAGR